VSDHADLDALRCELLGRLPTGSTVTVARVLPTLHVYRVVVRRPGTDGPA
jgi:hypothetical protein